MPASWINALVGGLIIGLAVSLMLLWNGRVTGISGIIYGLLTPKKQDVAWRASFVIGLVTGGFALLGFWDLPKNMGDVDWTVPVGGLLVGFGTVLGSGCTSGHGVCGMSRLSPRSLVATLLFIFSGMMVVYFMRHAMGVI